MSYRLNANDTTAARSNIRKALEIATSLATASPKREDASKSKLHGGARKRNLMRNGGLSMSRACERTRLESGLRIDLASFARHPGIGWELVHVCIDDASRTA